VCFRMGSGRGGEGGGGGGGGACVFGWGAGEVARGSVRVGLCIMCCVWGSTACSSVHGSISSIRPRLFFALCTFFIADPRIFSWCTETDLRTDSLHQSDAPLGRTWSC